MHGWLCEYIPRSKVWRVCFDQGPNNIYGMIFCSYIILRKFWQTLLSRNPQYTIYNIIQVVVPCICAVKFSDFDFESDELIRDRKTTLPIIEPFYGCNKSIT